ncbi:hypothetical protein P3L10_015401 [Capsicum annuum]
MPKYYHGIEKVKRSDFYTDFVMTENFFKEDDLYEIVKSGVYLNYDWGNECFRMLYKSNSHGLKTNPSSFIFGGFHLALQI